MQDLGETYAKEGDVMYVTIIAVKGGNDEIRQKAFEALEKAGLEIHDIATQTIAETTSLTKPR
jgi:hypothetical protein